MNDTNIFNYRNRERDFPMYLLITVNDLLSGGKVSEADYQKKAEGTIMNLMKEYE